MLDAVVPSNKNLVCPPTHMADIDFAWQDSYRSYKKALRMSKTTYYSALFDANTNNYKFLYNTITKLTRNCNCVEPCISIGLSSDDFMIYFLHKVANIINEIHHSSSIPGTIEDQLEHSNASTHLESFKQIGLSESHLPCKLDH